MDSMPRLAEHLSMDMTDIPAVLRLPDASILLMYADGRLMRLDADGVLTPCEPPPSIQ